MAVDRRRGTEERGEGNRKQEEQTGGEDGRMLLKQRETTTWLRIIR